MCRGTVLNGGRYDLNAAMSSSGGAPGSGGGGGGGKKSSNKTDIGEKKSKASKPDKPGWVEARFSCALPECHKTGQKMSKCGGCGLVFYCGRDHQKRHWKDHKLACRAAVAALAEDANRIRLARAVRETESGSEGVAGAEEDKLCVICFEPPVDPVEVKLLVYLHRVHVCAH